MYFCLSENGIKEKRSLVWKKVLMGFYPNARVERAFAILRGEQLSALHSQFAWSSLIVASGQQKPRPVCFAAGPPDQTHPPLPA